VFSIVNKAKHLGFHELDRTYHSNSISLHFSVIITDSVTLACRAAPPAPGPPERKDPMHLTALILFRSCLEMAMSKLLAQLGASVQSLFLLRAVKRYSFILWSPSPSPSSELVPLLRLQNWLLSSAILFVLSFVSHCLSPLPLLSPHAPTFVIPAP